MAAFVFRYHESIPEVSCILLSSRRSDVWSHESSAWEQTRYIAWYHRGKTKYLWDKKEHHVRVSWSNYEVFLKPNEKDGIVIKNDVVIGDDGQVIDMAYKKFINDAFWLCAPMNIKSTNIELSCVDLNIDQDGLMANYIAVVSRPEIPICGMSIKKAFQLDGKCGRMFRRWC